MTATLPFTPATVSTCAALNAVEGGDDCRGIRFAVCGIRTLKHRDPSTSRSSHGPDKFGAIARGDERHMADALNAFFGDIGAAIVSPDREMLGRDEKRDRKKPERLTRTLHEALTAATHQQGADAIRQQNDK